MAGLEDRREEFENQDCRVLAVNPADPDAHRRWAAMLGLQFPILSDPNLAAAKAYRARLPVLPVVYRTVYALDPNRRVIFAARGQADLNTVLETIKQART